MTEKIKIEVAPNLKMDIEVTADNVADIHVAAMEEELERLEKALAAELKEDEENLKEAQKKLDKATEDFGHTFTDNMEKELLPVMKRFGFKGLHTTFEAAFTCDDKVHIEVGLMVEGKRGIDNVCTGNIQTCRNVPFGPILREHHNAFKEAGEKVKKTTEKLLKVKEALGNIPKLERQARAQMAKNLLQTTDSGRQLLDMIRSKKAIPMDKD
jgi:hypothetical protein